MIWYVLGLLILTLAINQLALKFGFVDLNYSLKLDARDYEIGEPIEVYSTLENNKFFSVFYLKVEEYFPASFSVAKNAYSLFISPFQRVRRIYKVSAGKRGLYTLSRASLELGDFIGFKSRRQSCKLQQEVVILPKKIELGASIEPLGSVGGAVSVRRWIIDDPLMTIGVREYTGNEPQRFIHWPATAKHGSLMVKKFDFTTDNQVLVVLNVETMKPHWQAIEEELIEQGVSLARGVLEAFEEIGVPCGLLTNAYNEETGEHGYYHPVGLGAKRLRALLHTLGSIQFRIPSFFETTLQSILRRRGNYTTAVVITPRLLDSYIAPLNQLAKALPRLVVVAVEPRGLEDLDAKIYKYVVKQDD